MTDHIFLLQQNEELITLQAQPYDVEARLQDLLARYPNLLPIGQTAEDGDSLAPALLLITREASIPNDAQVEQFALDHLFLDRDGVPTLVEVKRASDTRARREVVAQMLDYASHFVVHWTADRIRTTFEQTCNQTANDPETRLMDFLDGIDKVDTFWQTVSNNLSAGHIRLVFVADRVPSELRRIVEFLNNQMNPAEVVAVEVPQFVGVGGVSTFVPRVVGQTEAARERKRTASAPARQWNEQQFMATLESDDRVRWLPVAQRLLEWARVNEMEISWGRGSANGSFVPRITVNGVSYVCFVVYTSGHVEISFQHMLGKPPFDDLAKRQELMDRLNRIPGAELPQERINSRPSIPAQALIDEDALCQFLAVWDWYFEKVRQANA